MDKRDILYERIRSWNKERNGLKLDIPLELKMLGEEMMEIYTAKNRAERLREAADYLFVSAGMGAKLEANLPSYGDRVLSTLLEGTLNTIIEVLKIDGTLHLLTDTLEIICDANDKKPKDTTTGKVIKGASYIDPIMEIKELIDNRPPIPERATCPNLN